MTMSLSLTSNICQASRN